jgi:hypothetical protein
MRELEVLKDAISHFVQIKESDFNLSEGCFFQARPKNNFYYFVNFTEFQ